MIRMMSITLCLLFSSISSAGGTFGDINRGQNQQIESKLVPAFSGDEASKQEMQDIQRQEEQQIIDDGELGTFHIQTHEDMIKGTAAEKKRQQRKQEADK